MGKLFVTVTLPGCYGHEITEKQIDILMFTSSTNEFSRRKNLRIRILYLFKKIYRKGQ